jgi:hypothetical protein
MNLDPSSFLEKTPAATAAGSVLMGGTPGARAEIILTCP